MPILDLAHYYLFDTVLGWLSLPLWKERRIVARVEDGPDEEGWYKLVLFIGFALDAPSVVGRCRVTGKSVPWPEAEGGEWEIEQLSGFIGHAPNLELLIFD
jgi:hypothetical protein